MADVGDDHPRHQLTLGELSQFAGRLADVVDGQSLDRLQHAGGRAAKGVALEVARDAVGADLAMSNFRTGRVRMGAGYDIDGNLIRLNLRPAGVWVLVDQGRKGRGRIWPRAGGRRGSGPSARRAVMTPQGPRAGSSWGPSGGKRVIARTAAKSADEAPRAVAKALTIELAKAVR